MLCYMHFACLVSFASTRRNFLHFNGNKSKYVMTNKKPTRCILLLLFYFLETQCVSGINMPICWSLWLCCWTTTLVVSFLICCVLEFGCSLARVVSRLPVEAQLVVHPNSNTQQIKNETANVVVQQHSRKLLQMGILMPQTRWVSKK